MGIDEASIRNKINRTYVDDETYVTQSEAEEVIKRAWNHGFRLGACGVSLVWAVCGAIAYFTIF